MKYFGCISGILPVVAILLLTGCVENSDRYAMPPIPAKDYLESEIWLNTLNEYIEENPDNASLHFRKAEYLFARDSYAEAEKSLSKALKLEPKNGLYLYFKGRLAEQNKQHNRALDSYEKAEAAGYDLPDLYRASIRTALAAKEYSKAKYYLYKLKKIYPGRTFSSFFNGIIYLNTGDTAKAIPYLQNCLTDTLSEFTLDAARQLSEISRAAGRPAESIDYLYIVYRHPKEEKKEKVGEQIILSLMELHKYDSAYTMAGTLMEQFDTTDVLLHLQSDALLSSHRYKDAAEVLQTLYGRAETLSNGMALLHALELAGEHKDAAVLGDTLLARHPDDHELNIMMHRLKKESSPRHRPTQRTGPDSLKVSSE